MSVLASQRQVLSYPVLGYPGRSWPLPSTHERT